MPMQNIIRDELQTVVAAIKDLHKITGAAAAPYLRKEEKELIENLACTVEHHEKTELDVS